MNKSQQCRYCLIQLSDVSLLVYIKFILMDQSTQPHRSKSFKALSMAQPIRKEIEQTLNKLEMEKRKFLANDREETLLKEELERKRKQLNSLKGKVPETVMDDKKTSQTNLKLRNADRTFEITLSNIQKLKQAITVARRQINKYKDVNGKLAVEQEELNKAIEKLIEDIVEKQNRNEELKNQIENYREMNMKNLAEFRKSHMNMTKSNFRDENSRRKYQVSTKTFLGEEVRQSRLVHFQMVSDALRNSGLMTNEGKVDIMTDSVPLAKARVNFIVHKNKEKIKIAEDYKKFGTALEEMFSVMKEYKGRDDVDYLASEFVAKEKQIEKLGQYIGKLEYRIVSENRELDHRYKRDQELEEEVTKDTENDIDKQYAELNKHVKEEINELRIESQHTSQWLKKVGQIFCPLVSDDDFSRGNSVNVMGKIEQLLSIEKTDEASNRRQASPIKQLPAPVIDSEEHHHRYNELLSYDKMKEYADEYIKSKRA